METLRTPEERFANLEGYAFAPHYHEYEGVRMHYLDEGPRDGPVMLLVHGMPTWSYLYRRMIPILVDAGYRCIAADFIGFGKSDKVVDDAWYSIERHCLSLRSLVEALDLQRVTVLVQDWGGPTGLYQPANMPERFDRLCIMNTWVENEAYEAPFPSVESKAGARRFPLSLPFWNPVAGDAEGQGRTWKTLLGWKKPVHFIWAHKDPNFSEKWLETWAAHYPQATLDRIADAGHFLQETHGPQVAELLLKRIAQEPG